MNIQDKIRNSLGYSLYKIAKHYDMSTTSLIQFIKRGKLLVEPSISYQVRACENAWHHILDFGQPAALETQAPALTEESLNKEI